VYLRGKGHWWWGKALMGNIKVTFLAERVKAGERFCDKRI